MSSSASRKGCLVEVSVHSPFTTMSATDVGNADIALYLFLYIYRKKFVRMIFNGMSSKLSCYA